MQEREHGQPEKAFRSQAGQVGFEAVVPNPKLKLLDQVREVMRLKQLIRLAPARLTPLGL
jgi:hypothetical protein